jgi:nicotinamide mononucleotide transporter PnuC
MVSTEIITAAASYPITLTELKTYCRVDTSSDDDMLTIFIAAATGFLWWLLGKLGGAAKFWDALTTSISLSAQWLQSRKKLECWHLWILADVIYVPLYISRGLNLTALLYGVFLCMAVMGLLAWQKSVKTWPTPESSASS